MSCMEPHGLTSSDLSNGQVDVPRIPRRPHPDGYAQPITGHPKIVQVSLDCPPSHGCLANPANPPALRPRGDQSSVE